MFFPRGAGSLTRRRPKPSRQLGVLDPFQPELTRLVLLHVQTVQQGLAACAVSGYRRAGARRHRRGADPRAGLVWLGRSVLRVQGTPAQAEGHERPTHARGQTRPLLRKQCAEHRWPAWIPSACVQTSRVTALTDATATVSQPPPRASAPAPTPRPVPPARPRSSGAPTGPVAPRRAVTGGRRGASSPDP